VIWMSKLQSDIATSTFMAKYTAMSMAMWDVLPLKHIVKAVSKGVGMEPTDLVTIKTIVWEDNNGAPTLVKMEPGHMTPRLKHFAVWYHQLILSSLIRSDSTVTCLQKCWDPLTLKTFAIN
jgi:hypothetical protein